MCVKERPTDADFGCLNSTGFMKNRLTALLPITLLLTACSGEVEDTLPGQPIKHRQDAFHQILQTFEPMGIMLRTKAYDAERFNELMAAFMETRDAPWGYFEAGSDVPPSDAKAEIWSNAVEFEAQRQQFMQLSDALQTVAKAKDETAVKMAYKKLHGSCRQCHDDFRD